MDGRSAPVLEKEIIKKMQRMCGRVPVGSLDLLRIVAHPLIIKDTLQYLLLKQEEDLKEGN